MRIFAVNLVHRDGTVTLEGLFSSHELAEEYVDDNKYAYTTKQMVIEEHTVDGLHGKQRNFATHYTVRLSIRNGKPFTLPGDLDVPTVSEVIFPDGYALIAEVPYRHIMAESPISAEHALEIAKARLNEWVNEKRTSRSRMVA